jgi:SagB-type dehydrogenase family enzyme
VRTPLARPDTARLSNADVPFTRVQEERRSLRAFGEEPLSLEQLAEFLFRTARVKEERRNGQLVARRPYPAAGGLYELEIYALVDRCRGLDPGAYHYDPREHALTRLSGDSGAHGRLLDDARDAAGTSPQVLLVLAARFATVFWKYESIGYSLILKDVGVLQHAMSLVATAMGLGACILGAGDSDAFCEAVGTDYYEESSVGELVLGSRPEAGPG